MPTQKHGPVLELLACQISRQRFKTNVIIPSIYFHSAEKLTLDKHFGNGHIVMVESFDDYDKCYMAREILSCLQ